MSGFRFCASSTASLNVKEKKGNKVTLGKLIDKKKFPKNKEELEIIIMVVANQ